MRNGIYYVVGAGENYGLDFQPATGDLVIAADAGLCYLEEQGIRTDLVIGDFDTLKCVLIGNCCGFFLFPALPYDYGDGRWERLLGAGLIRGTTLFPFAVVRQVKMRLTSSPALYIRLLLRH